MKYIYSLFTITVMLMNLLFKILLSCAICCIFSFDVIAQRYSTPISPERDSYQKEIGVFVGLGQNAQLGDMYVDCEDCTFRSGTKFGYTFGLLYEQDLFSNFKIGASAAYDYKGYQSRYQEIEALNLDFDVNGQTVTENVNLKFRHTADVDLSFITLSPYIKWEPWTFMFIRAGIGFAFNTSNTIIHIKELNQKTVRLSTGQTREVNIDKSEQQNSNIDGFKSFQTFISPALGFTIPFSKTVFFSPIFQYDIPLSIISDKGKDLKISSWRFLFELRIAIQARFKS